MAGLVPAIHAFLLLRCQDVDARHKAGHDEDLYKCTRGTLVLLRILDRLEEILISTLMAAATILIFISVVHRFGTSVPFLYPYLIAIHISWAQELCIYMFIWMAKFGAAYGVRTGIHVGVDVLINRLNPRWQKGVILFGLLGGALFTVIVGTMGAKFVIELMSTDQVSPDLELPSWLVYACIPLGSYLMCFRFLQVAWTYFWTGNLPHHDATHVDGVEVSSKAPIALGEA
jgi:C4-dicarboxylate transporter DctQ subunit